MALFPQKKGMMSPSMPQGSTRRLMGLPEQEKPAYERPSFIKPIQEIGKSILGSMRTPAYIQGTGRAIEGIKADIADFTYKPKYKEYQSSDTGISYEGMSAEDADAIWAARNMVGQAPLSQEIQSRYRVDQYGRPTSQIAEQARLREVAQKRQQAADQFEMAAAQQAQRQGAMSPQGVVTPEFRASLMSPASTAVNPYGQEYLSSQKNIASSQVAKQYGQAREELRAKLGAAGITSDSPAFQSMMAKLASEEASAKATEIDRRQQFAAQQGAQFEMERTRAEADWQKFLQDTARNLALQPTEIASREAQIQSQNIQNIMNNLNVEEKQRTIDFAVQDAANKAAMSGIEVSAAEIALARSNPNAWFNSPLWPFLGPALGAIIGGVVGGPAGAVYGAQLGGVATNLIPGQDAESIGNLIERSGLMSPRTQGPRMSPQGETSLDVTRRGRMTQPENIPIQRAPYPGYGGQLPRTRF